MKTVLVALNAKFVHSNLAIRYMKAYSHRYDIDLFETSINDSFMDTALNILEKKPDLVAFSCYLWNIDMALKVSSIIKEVSPDTILIFGGPEVSYNGDDYLYDYPYLDYLICGEGEITFHELIGEISSGNRNFKRIDGLIYRNNGEVVKNAERKPIANLDVIPFPYEHEIPGKILYYEASRGCPFSCTYCLSGSLGGIRFFGIDRVKADLKKLIDAKVELVKFVDRTFNANKKFANEIWEFLIDYANVEAEAEAEVETDVEVDGNVNAKAKAKANTKAITEAGKDAGDCAVKGHSKCKTKFHFEIAADLLEEQSLEILKRAPKDLFQFEIGVQSTNAEVLKNINRIMNFEKVKTNIIELKQAGGNIHCHLDLIAGLPGEDLVSFIKSFEDCMRIEPEVLQLGFLKVLKGTDIYKDLDKYGIHYMKYPNYHVLYTHDLEFDQVKYLLKFEKVFETYYNSGIFGITLKYVLPLVDKKYVFFQEFTTFLSKNEFFIRSIDLKEKFRLFYEFLTTVAQRNLIEKIEKLTQKDDSTILETSKATLTVETDIAAAVAPKGEKFDSRVIKDLLIHDYISNTKKTSIPEFLRKEINLETKELVNANKEMLMSYFNGIEIKKLFYIPVDTKVVKRGINDSILIENGVLIYNPVSGDYCYL